MLAKTILVAHSFFLVVTFTKTMKRNFSSEARNSISAHSHRTNPAASNEAVPGSDLNREY